MPCGRQLFFSDAELLVVDALLPLDAISCSAGFAIKVSNSFFLAVWLVAIIRVRYCQ